MTILEAKKAIAVERKILLLLRDLESLPETPVRVSFQIARISELEQFIISTTLAEASAQSSLETAPVSEPAILLEPNPALSLAPGPLPTPRPLPPQAP